MNLSPPILNAGQEPDLIGQSDRDEIVITPGVQDSESALRHYWRMIVRRRWVILGIVGLGLLVGLAYALLAQREYAATVTIEIARESARIVDVEEVQPRLGADQEFYQTQYALLESRSLAEMVVRDLRLANDDSFLTDYGSGGDDAIAGLNRDQREQLAITKVMDGVEVIPVRLSSVVNLRYVSPDPGMAAAVANSVAENFIEQNLARRFESSAYARQFLEERLAQMRQRLEESEREAVGYAAQQQIINIAPTSRDPDAPPQEQSLVAADLGAINESLAEARATRIAAEARYRQATGGSAAAEALGNTTINALRQQRATLRAEYQKQLNNFTPDYPPVAALAAQIAEVDRQIAAETGLVRSGVSANLRDQYQQAAAAERQLAARVDQLKGELVDQRRRSIQYNIYQREVDTNRALYDALLQRYREVGIAGVGNNNISVVDPAKVPTTPSRPNVPLILLVSVIVGAMLGAAAALILEQLDDAAILPGDFESKLGVPLLGSVPKLENGEIGEALGDPKSPASEAYLSVLTSLQLSTTHGMPRSVLVTSSQEAEGKSTTSVAIAQALARLGERVLLIDADMRRPSLHKSLQLDNREGLSSLLAGESEFSALTQQTKTPNLFAITSGRLPPNPSELLAGDGMARLLAAAGERFDRIVVDGPPILGLADAPLLARASEATVFVLQAGRTRATQARHALRRLQAVRAPIAGAVLSKFDQKASGYGYGYGYDYAYGA